MIIVLRNIILKNNRIEKHCRLKYFLQHLLYLQFRGHEAMTVDSNKTFSTVIVSRVLTLPLLGKSRPQLHYRDLDVDEYQEEYF